MASHNFVMVAVRSLSLCCLAPASVFDPETRLRSLPPLGFFLRHRLPWKIPIGQPEPY
jgi:hypothetical protein